MKPTHLKLFRSIELLALFVGVPVWMFWDRLRTNPLLIGLVAAGICLSLLLMDRTFDRSQLWNWSGTRQVIRSILLRFVFCATVVTVAVAIFQPDDFLMLPRTRPGLWGMIMLFYPLVSVWPQEMIYRAFFFHRYRALFGGDRATILASAVAFGFMHLAFQNWVAVAMTLVGGAFFASTFARSRSLLATSIEHSLYGQLIFTVGLGTYFYHGTVRAAGG